MVCMVAWWQPTHRVRRCNFGPLCLVMMVLLRFQNGGVSACSSSSSAEFLRVASWRISCALVHLQAKVDSREELQQCVVIIL